MQLRYLKELDGVRGIAALMVMFFHFFSSGPYPQVLLKISGFGQSGVTLFFVLSGFLITRILLHSKHQGNYFKAFYTRRTLRIFPLYFFFLCLYYLLIPYLKDVSLEQEAPRWYFWCFLQNIPMSFNQPFYGPDHYWSLAVEEHFYLVLPFVVYFLSAKRIMNVLFFVIGLTLVFRIIMVLKGYQPFYFTLTSMDALSMGALLAFYERKYGFTPEAARRSLWLSLLLLPLLAAVWIFAGSKEIVPLMVVKHSLIALVYLALVFYAAGITKKHFFKKFLTSGPMQYTGRISYGLYVYHPLCFLAIKKFLNSQGMIVDLLLAFALTYLAASISFYLFEAKILSLKKYFNYGDKPVPVLAESKVTA